MCRDRDSNPQNQDQDLKKVPKAGALPQGLTSLLVLSLDSDLVLLPLSALQMMRLITMVF